MAGRTRCQPSDDKIATVESEIVRIRSLGIAELRGAWRDVFKSDAPEGFTKDLIGRRIAFKVQEDAFGGFDRATIKILDARANGKPTPTNTSRNFKPGTELFREYQGTRHAVVVMEDGFAWKGKTYASLTTIAKAITGTNWNGPRFFGLREGRAGEGHAPKSTSGNQKQKQLPQLASA